MGEGQPKFSVDPGDITECNSHVLSNASEGDNLSLDIEELDDKEFQLPPVESPTLESILNETSSLSDEEVSAQVSGLFREPYDSLSVSSTESPSEKRARKQQSGRDSIMRHVVLRGVSSQLQSAAQRVDAGKPTAMAVSSLIAVGTFHGLVLVFDPSQALKWCLGSRQLGDQYGSVSALGFNNDCTRLLSGYAKGQLTMWDLTNGKLLRTIMDVHPPQTAVLHAKFTDDPTLAICSDSGGSVFQLNFKKVLNNRTCESTCIFSGSRGEVCTMEPLRVTQNFPDHPAQDLFLLALGTVTKVIVVTLRPVLRVRMTHPLKEDGNTLPLLGWQFVVIQVSNATRFVDPVLAFARKNIIFLFQVSITHPEKMSFIPLQRIEVQYAIQNFTWLNSRTLVVLDTSEHLHVLDVRSQEELEVLDISDVQMVYGSSHFKGHATGGNVSKAMAAAGRRACYHSVAGFGTQVLFLGVKSIHVLTLRTWLERIECLWKQDLYPEALALALSFHNDTAKAVSGLVGKKAERQWQTAQKLQELLLTFADMILASPEGGKVLMNHLSETVPLCVEYCIALESSGLLERLYEQFSVEPMAQDCFLQSLSNPILEGQISRLSPAMAKDFVNFLASREMFSTLEMCLVRLNIACLDIHQVMKLCWEHDLYDGIIYIYNRGMCDYKTPIEEFMAMLEEAVQHGRQLTDKQVTLGNKLLVYISCCLAGRGYPHGNIEPASAVPQVKKEVFDCITALHGTKSKGNAIYPSLKTLLHFNTREFLNVLALAFEEEELKTKSGLAQKQRVVDILLQIMVKSEGFSPTQVGALFTFLARQLARPDNTLVVNRLLFEQVVEYLTQSGEDARLEERQQALMELIQTGGLASMDDSHLLALVQKANFYRVCEYLYAKQKRYDKIFLCYLKDPSRKPQTFYYATQVLESSDVDEQDKKMLQDQLIANVQDLLDVDNTATSQLMLHYLAHRVDDVVKKLEGCEQVLYDFLQGIWNSREQERHTSQGDEFHRMDVAIQEKYVELMCRFDPPSVLKFLLSSDGYRLEETLEICRKHNVMDAMAHLLEKAGNIHEAFKILLEFLESKLNKYLSMEKEDQDDVAFAAVDTQLCFIIQLCQRNSPKLDTAQREALWFPLLEVVMAPQRLAEGNSKELPGLKILTHHLLASMMGFVALPRILHKLVQDPTYSSGKFAQVKDLIVKMLDTHNYEKALLNTTNRLLNYDLHSSLNSLKSVANRGYASHSPTCSTCHKNFAQLDNLVMFRCGHCYHESCMEQSLDKGHWYCLSCFPRGKKPTPFSKRILEWNDLRPNRKPNILGLPRSPVLSREDLKLSLSPAPYNIALDI
ncbi:vacuolar protein sorting-associated protein 8 homolog [Ornithodoros turicata]|uniref:vacuolar protein sorting-associated protein 8 homolog n=1 Tax=Ornithodoros turicata TaxID=34597 RepID=UPI003139F219